MIGKDSVRYCEPLIFSCFLPGEFLNEHRMSYHHLVQVCDGMMEIYDGDSKVTVGRGECVFLKRDCKVYIHKHSLDGTPYRAVNIRFRRETLRNYCSRVSVGCCSDASCVSGLAEAAIKLPVDLYLESLFSSLRPFLDRDILPNQYFIDKKTDEALTCLLQIDDRFYPTLFDFNEVWKIDIMQFMEENFTENLTMQEFASYTGRSLSTFKRDFAKLSSKTPQKWLIDRRLDYAASLLKEGRTVADTSIATGFRDRSHFTRSFIKKFGCSPSVYS